MICDLYAGLPVDGCFVLKGAFPKTTAAGKPFLSAVLSDRSGSIETKVWDYPGPIGPKDEGKIVRVRGNVSEYRGQLQLIADQFYLAGEQDRICLEDLVPVAPVSPEVEWDAIDAAVSSMRDPDYAAICRDFLERCGEELKVIPAAKSVHHAFVRGLLMHTTSMLRLADFLAMQYASVIDRDLLLKEAKQCIQNYLKSRDD